MNSFARLARRSVAAFALASVVGIGALGAFAAAPAFADDRPDLVIAVNKLARSLESAEQMGNVDVRITYNIFDSLIRRNFLADGSGEASTLAPGLAESWKRIDDRTVELSLRKGVKFHNGDEMTAEDVAFSYSRARLWGPESVIRQARRYWGHLERVEVVDKYTVRVIAKEPDVMLEHRLAGYASWIVPLKPYILKGKDHFARNPVGTGPYKFVEWKDGEHMKFEAFDEYWGGKPTAKTLTFKVVPETAARIAGLVSGEFDMIVNIPPDQIATINRYDDVEARSIVLNNSHVLVFNTNNPIIDQPLRQALAMSIDRDLLRKALWFDRNYTPNGHQLPSYVMYEKDRPGFAFDPEKAKALLAQSKYKGEELIYRIIPNYYLNSMEAAQAMQQMWKQVGINVKLAAQENWKQVRDVGWDIYPWSNTHRLPDPLGSFVPQWGPRSGVQKNKLIAWKAPKDFNDAVKTIETSADWAERKVAYMKALDLWQTYAPGTILYNPLETYGVKKSISWKPYALYYMDFRPENLKFTGNQRASR